MPRGRDTLPSDPATWEPRYIGGGMTVLGVWRPCPACGATRLVRAYVPRKPFGRATYCTGCTQVTLDMPVWQERLWSWLVAPLLITAFRVQVIETELV